MPNVFFSAATFRFLARLEKNNNRPWFDAHKQEYEDVVRTPALQFIAAMETDLHRISSQFIADPRKLGGSLMRIYRGMQALYS